MVILVIHSNPMATINLRGIPEELHHQFKAVCALQGKTINEAIQELMRREVEKELERGKLKR